MKLLLTLTALVLAVYGQPPQQQRCTKTPALWTGAFYENDFTAEGFEPYIRFAFVDYDSTAGDERIRIIEFEELNRPGRVNRFRLEEFYLFKEKKQYIYDYQTEECRASDLTNEFRPFGVINDAEYRGRTYLGVKNVPKLGLDVDHFYYSRSENSVNSHYSSYWVPVPNTDENICVPVEQHFINLTGPRQRGPNIDARFTFLNITSVASFPANTFKPPEKCLQL